MASARTLLSNPLLRAHRLGSHVAADEGLRTLPPGEQARFRVTGRGCADAKRARAVHVCADTE
ncbi:hypothetical protein ACGFZA_22290 [Streptomyces sp. NPDC048211]|uniref:hypothetical protein n=1 Tax=Streptomyces sp. NPDC048211 TaxID=3365516 RepID=UPI003711F4CC